MTGDETDTSKDESQGIRVNHPIMVATVTRRVYEICDCVLREVGTFTKMKGNSGTRVLNNHWGANIITELNRECWVKIFILPFSGPLSNNDSYCPIYTDN